MAGSGEGARLESVQLKPPEAPRVDEPQFAPRRETQDRVGVWGYRDVGGRNQEPAGHAEMDKQLLTQFAAGFRCEVNNDVLADAVNAGNAQAS
jgi:hypothetical protein